MGALVFSSARVKKKNSSNNPIFFSRRHAKPKRRDKNNISVQHTAVWCIINTFSASCPEVSERMRGTTSSASANFLMAYWSSPVCSPKKYRQQQKMIKTLNRDRQKKARSARQNNTGNNIKKKKKKHDRQRRRHSGPRAMSGGDLFSFLWVASKIEQVRQRWLQLKKKCGEKKLALKFYKPRAITRVARARAFSTIPKEGYVKTDGFPWYIYSVERPTGRMREKKGIFGP